MGEIMDELCNSEQVELQENGIIRNSNGIIIGRIDRDNIIEKLKKEIKSLKKLLKMIRRM